MEILIAIYLPLKEDFHKIEVQGKIFVIYNFIGPQFCDKPSYSRRQIAVKIYANLRLACSGVEQLSPEQCFCLISLKLQ